MSVAMFEETKKDIEEAYRSKNTIKIEKETQNVLNQFVILMTNVFKDRINSITFDQVDYKHSYIHSDANHKDLNSWLQLFLEIKKPYTDHQFGELKFNLENWYYKIGGKKITFNYHTDYLITPSQASEELGVSKVTLNKYIKQGLEVVDTTSHHKIPKHAIELWKDPILGIKVQMLAQQRKLLNQSPEERISEINEEILELQKKYKATSLEDAFKSVEIDAMDDPSDYFEWRDLEEEKEELMVKILGAYGDELS
jgi:hypothetical protein